MCAHMQIVTICCVDLGGGTDQASERAGAGSRRCGCGTGLRRGQQHRVGARLLLMHSTAVNMLYITPSVISH